MLHQNIDHCFGIVDKIVRIELKFFKFGVLSYKVFDRVFQDLDYLSQGGLIGRSFNVEDDFVFDSQFLGDRQGVGGGPSMVEVVDGGHFRAQFVENLKWVK